MIPNGYNTPPDFMVDDQILAGVGSIGTDYFVDANAGVNTNDGLTWESSVNTLAAAITLSNANIAAGATGWANRNRIFYKGDNAEAAAETLITLPNKCDVIGVGSYDHRPMPFLIGNHVIGAGAYMGTRFINMGFASPAAGGVIFTVPTTTSGLAFIGCDFDGRSSTAATKAIVATAVEQFTVKNCRFYGKYSTATIEMGAGAARLLLIEGNQIESGAIGVLINSGLTCANGTAKIINNIFNVVTIVVDENSDKVIIGGNRGITSAAQTLALIFDYSAALAYDNIITSATATSIYPALGAIG